MMGRMVVEGEGGGVWWGIGDCWEMREVFVLRSSEIERGGRSIGSMG